MASPLKFKGIKHLQVVDPTVKEIWEQVFEGDYRMPKCPACGNSMELERLNVERTTDTTGILGSSRKVIIESPRETIYVAFQCLNCRIFMRGYGKGLNISKVEYSLEEFFMTNYEVKVKGDEI